MLHDNSAEEGKGIYRISVHSEQIQRIHGVVIHRACRQAGCHAAGGALEQGQTPTLNSVESFMTNEHPLTDMQVSARVRVVLVIDLNGAGTKSRTRDLLITNQLLYQLSYTGSTDCSNFVEFGVVRTRYTRQSCFSCYQGAKCRHLKPFWQRTWPTISTFFSLQCQQWVSIPVRLGLPGPSGGARSVQRQTVTTN